MPGSNKNVYFSLAVALNAAPAMPHMNNHAFTVCPAATKKKFSLDVALNAARAIPHMKNHVFTACLAATTMSISPRPLS